MALLISCWQLFSTFFMIGLFTFGGGYAMIPMIRTEVLNHGWLQSSELIDFIAISESTPGPFAINIATFTGTEVANVYNAFAGLLGAACATLGVVLPSFIIILIVAKFFHQFKDHKVVRGVLSGLRPTVIGLIAAAALSIALSVLLPNFTYQNLDFSMFNWKALIIAVLAFAFSQYKKKLHPIYMIIGSAVLGIILFGIL